MPLPPPSPLPRFIPTPSTSRSFLTPRLSHRKSRSSLTQSTPTPTSTPRKTSNYKRPTVESDTDDSSPPSPRKSAKKSIEPTTSSSTCNPVIPSRTKSVKKITFPSNPTDSSRCNKCGYAKTVEDDGRGKDDVKPPGCRKCSGMEARDGEEDIWMMVSPRRGGMVKRRERDLEEGMELEELERMLKIDESWAEDGEVGCLDAGNVPEDGEVGCLDVGNVAECNFAAMEMDMEKIEMTRETMEAVTTAEIIDGWVHVSLDAAMTESGLEGSMTDTASEGMVVKVETMENTVAHTFALTDMKKSVSFSSSESATNYREGSAERPIFIADSPQKMHKVSRTPSATLIPPLSTDPEHIRERDTLFEINYATTGVQNAFKMAEEIILAGVAERDMLNQRIEELEMENAGLREMVGMLKRTLKKGGIEVYV